MSRKLLALLLIPVAILCIVLGFAGLIYLDDWGEFAVDFLGETVLAAGLVSGLALIAYANRLWQGEPPAIDDSEELPPNHLYCDWCYAAVPVSNGKLVAMPSYQGLEIGSDKRFVCHPCLRKHRKMRWIAILAVLGMVGGYLLACYLMFG